MSFKLPFKQSILLVEGDHNIIYSVLVFHRRNAGRPIFYSTLHTKSDGRALLLCRQLREVTQLSKVFSLIDKYFLREVLLGVSFSILFWLWLRIKKCSSWYRPPQSSTTGERGVHRGSLHEVKGGFTSAAGSVTTVLCFYLANDYKKRSQIGSGENKMMSNHCFKIINNRLTKLFFVA